MKIQICSDLHLEFSKNREWLKHNPLVPKSEILIIAGDTYYLERDYSKLDFINKISKDFKHVYLIPGNHEYYGGYDAATALFSRQIEIKKNVHMLNNTSVQIGDVNFIFSTLWSKIEKNVNEIKRGMNDFRLIKFEEERFTINDYNMIHNKAFDFISNERLSFNGSFSYVDARFTSGSLSLGTGLASYTNTTSEAPKLLTAFATAWSRPRRWLE